MKPSFAGYAVNGDSAALLAALRVIARVKGISSMAEEIGMTRQGLQKALSTKGNPRLDNINAIMRAMGLLAPASSYREERGVNTDVRPTASRHAESPCRIN